ncbi:hypothetical protein BC940DRAFT_306279 [Gongronella butleri]|nr:hypothetical protein BC940DRAFT_306279 [Gongronella butleri]
MSKLVIDDIDRTLDYEQFIASLKEFHLSKGTTLQAEPVLGGKKIDLYKLYCAVQQAGGFEIVTKKRSWKQLGDSFEFPPTCTNSAYILKGLYIRNLLGWEEEKVWDKNWVPPAELLGPDAHKASTLAGKSFKKPSKKVIKGSSSSNGAHSSSHRHQHHPHYHHHKHHSHHSVQTIQPAIAPDQPFSPDMLAQFASQFVPPSDRSIIDQPHTCTISELHHQNQPSHHLHSEDNAPVHTTFDSNTTQQILAALQFGDHTAVEWALKNLVTISFECPEELRLDRHALLLESLLNIAEVSLKQSDEAECMMEHTLQILHILRNFSFLPDNARLLASSAKLKQMMIKNLVLSSSHYTHCIDVLENVAKYIEIGPSDNYILCLVSLVYTNERHVLLGSIRVLTLLSLNQQNQTALIPGSAQTADRILQLLVVHDEEVVGAALEYLFQFARISNAFRLQLLTVHAGADLGVLVSLLMAKSKYFKPLILQQEKDNSPPNSPMSASYAAAVFAAHGHGPCVPDLKSYQELDEPYRCLGWLKDKFELAEPSSVISLDDMFLLYEIRFGHNQLLSIQDFYSVLNIAFPRTTTSPSLNGSSTPTGPVLEGTCVRGIQIKMSILQDGCDLLCQWTDCSQTFRDELQLQQHVLEKHIETKNDDQCLWTNCGKQEVFTDKEGVATHLRSHFDNDLLCDNKHQHASTNSHAQHPHTFAHQLDDRHDLNFESLSLSSSTAPSSPASITGNTTTTMIPTTDTSPVRGIPLVAALLLNQLSKDPNSHVYFMPYERELTLIARQRPQLAQHIQTIFANFSSIL